MSILKSYYEISVWEDKIDSNGLPTEKRICLIGSSDMEYQGRVLNPTLTRNVNGSKKLTFKMYKQFIDNVTGEKIENPFAQLLTNETKIKLLYEDKWYDFFIKNVNENSSQHLCTYQLEDALVQELSKNGFGVTLDAELMNNLGTVGELGSFVMSDTGWDVESEAFVETVEDSLVYIKLPNSLASYRIYHIIDQEDLSQGIEEVQLTNSTTPKLSDLGGKTILAFYSSCKNKPHRFQFIFNQNTETNPYGKNSDGTYRIARKDDRVINQADCQYYIEFSNPNEDYMDPKKIEETDPSSKTIQNLGLWLPKKFSIGDVGAKKDEQDNTIEEDSVLSSWYRGKRYGFAQETVYVPVLERYCQKFSRPGNLDITNAIVLYSDSSSGKITGDIEYSADGSSCSIGSDQGCSKSETPWSGFRFNWEYQLYEVYKVEYDLQVTDGKLENIGGHNAAFATIYEVQQNGASLGKTTSSVFTFSTPLTTGTIHVIAQYTYIDPNAKQPYIFIQPNRGSTTEVNFKITNLTIKTIGDYLGYKESKFVSPTLIQNCINNYKFESTGGWYASSATNTDSATKPSVENVYGRFTKEGQFVSIIEDFENSDYTEDNEYKAYLKISLYNNTQFILNSGLKDNRTMIGNIATGEEWVLDYKICKSDGTSANDQFNFSIGEYIYNTASKTYVENTANITFSQSDNQASPRDEDYGRIVFNVDSSNFTETTFKKNSKTHLKITPVSVSGSPSVWYIEDIALYRKSLDSSMEIIVPDYNAEGESKSVEKFIEDCVLEEVYHYFSADVVNPEKTYSITNKEDLSTIQRKQCDYAEFKPVYNEGAQKVRTVSAKESNYFNILQSIAETFEAWLDLEIGRDSTGKITSKAIKFKNYAGADNFAGFRYGVNLKDITRTCDSKNITTKLIVKQNANELAEGGFCTIQKAGANPTGENYIYDFQYFHNQGLMDVQDYLKTVYYIDGANGPDWSGYDSSKSTNINGYYQRVKSLNESYFPIAEEITRLNGDLLKKQAIFEVAKATQEASVSGIAQVREDFQALTGVYPEEIQADSITEIEAYTDGSMETVVPQEDWWLVPEDGVDIEGQTATINIQLAPGTEVCSAKVEQSSELSSCEELTDNGYEISKKEKWSGLYLNYAWEKDRLYTLTYTLKVKGGELKRVGGHTANFKNVSIEVTDSKGKSIQGPASVTNGVLELENSLTEGTIIVKMTITACASFTEPDSNNCLWIQPNRGIEDEISCQITNIKLTKQVTGTEVTKDYDRTAHFYLNVKVFVGGTPISRTYEVSCKVPANAETASVTQAISSVDMQRSDVQKYLTEYVTYYEKQESSSKEIEKLTPEINNLEKAIQDKKVEAKQLLEYKKELNKLFYEKYSRFILEGTWISEEHTDNEKYYTDAQSVLYNSCYPQVVYNISVLSLSQLPSYEEFSYNLGDKTFVIDDEFFGKDIKQEIVVTETSHDLDDPLKNTIKVQTFKDQFQSLFQKITATTQQVQYNVGSYERNNALMDANVAKQNEFLTNILNSADSYLQYGQTVESNASGITITDDSDRHRQLRLVGGAILFSAEDPETKEPKWRTGLTNEGISADLITAGRLDAGAVQIMSGNEPVFRWDAYGISAYDATWTTADGISTISGIDSKRFVRFDKHGIYGINNVEGIDGSSWHPASINQIEDNATFALTWEGLKVTGNDNVVARIGKMDDAIIKVNDGSTDTFIVEPDGDVTVKGTLILSSGDTVEDAIDTSTNDAITNFIETDFEPFKSSIETQVDGKTETWYQAEDPSVVWTTSELKRQHEGDLWKYTGEKTTTRDKNSEWVWQRIVYKGTTEYDYDVWVYHGDFSKQHLWNTSHIYTASNNGFGYYYYDSSESTWVQAKTGTNTNWPSGAGPALVGANIITTSQKCYIENTGRLWSYSSGEWSAPEDVLFGKWKEMEVPEEVFDKIDGKSNIFVALPSSGGQINEGDILIPTANITSGSKTYYSGKVYRYTKKSGASSYSWEPVDYVDESKVNEKIAEALEDLGLPDTDNLVMKDDLAITKTVDESTGVTTIAVTDKSGNNISSTTIGEKYVATDVGLGDGQLENGKKFILKANGTLNADNAVIHGTIFANEGYIAGWHVSQSKSGSNYSGSLTYGDLGGATGFHMYGNNYGVAGTIAGKTVSGTTSLTNPGWKLGVGSGFGVTSDGGVYATHGQIGDMAIEHINSLTGNGRNLLLASDKLKNNKGYPVATYFFDITPEEGKVYTVSLRGELYGGCTRFAAFNSGGGIWLQTLSTNISYTGNTSGMTSGTRHFTTTIANPPSSDWNLLFADGAVIAITNNGSLFTRDVQTYLNVKDASDSTTSNPKGTLGYEVKINGKSINKENYFDWPAGTIKYFQFKKTGVLSSGLNAGYWDLAVTYSGTFTWRNKHDSTSVVPSGLYIYAGTEAGQVTNSVNKVFWAKLEEGPAATPWTLAESEKMSAEEEGDYSWVFSPTRGMYMYNGDQSTTPVLKVDGTGLSLNGSLSATYLYAGEAKDGGIVFQTGNPNAAVKEITTRVFMSTPKGLTDAEGNTTYSCHGRIPDGYNFNEDDITVPRLWTKNISGNVITLTQIGEFARPPATPSVTAKLTEVEARKYGIKISSNNDIYVPIYNTDSKKYEDIELTSLIAQLVLEN